MFIALLNSAVKLRLCSQVTKSKQPLIDKCSDFIANYSTMSYVQIKGNVDQFHGITIDSKKQPFDVDTFRKLLAESLEEWTAQKKRGIWFKVHLNQSDWVPVLAKNGFSFHHAKNEYVMMIKWLPQDEECNVPPYAHTLLGVGAVVVNDNDEVLVVSEKHYNKPHWKLPGGYVEPGENLVDAAIREVWEETNIHTEFRSILSYRHAHGGQFDCSDLYTVVALKPLSLDITKCEKEISDCIWMKLDEYMGNPLIHELNRFFVKKYLDNKNDAMKIDCTHGVHQILKKPYTVYHAAPESSDIHK